MSTKINYITSGLRDEPRPIDIISVQCIHCYIQIESDNKNSSANESEIQVSFYIIRHRKLNKKS